MTYLELLPAVDVADGQAVGTILNDDTEVSLAVAPASMAEDAPGGLVYTFTRVGMTSGALTVNFNVGGTAAFGSDYAQSGAVLQPSAHYAAMFPPA